MSGWIGVDLDGTLAEYHGWSSLEDIGNPIPRMQERVKQWLAEGKEVRIFTARANVPSNILYIEEWCTKHLGQTLKVTATKDLDMMVLYDDRAIQVIRNTGELLQERLGGYITFT